MDVIPVGPWVHDHTFGQDRPKTGERRTRVVIAITAVTMAVEVAAGLLFGSMALLADGLHMGSHAAALTVSALGYYYTRRHARDPRFNFGAGKINSLAAFASAVLLVVIALVMAGESAKRFAVPVPIDFNQAILVAVLGLVVNGVCLAVLGTAGYDHGHATDAGGGHGAAEGHEHGHGHGHGHEHGHKHKHGHEHEHGHEHGHGHGHGHGEARSPNPEPGPAQDGAMDPRFQHDHNLWSAYLHVVADALTSVLAIVALLAGKYLGQHWMDPFMGLVGAVLVVRWSVGLLGGSGRVLLDMQAPESVRSAVRTAIESDGDARVTDLHVWAVGPSIHAAAISIVAGTPQPPEAYRRKLPQGIGLVHVTVEVWRQVEQEPRMK